MSVLIIPARGGSKRIPRKNIRKFNHQPMISWSIKAAIEAGIFDKILVSTDDLEIAEIAKQYGAQVPFVRPEALSNDEAGTVPVIAHAISWLQENEAIDISAVCCLYATAPFVTAEDLIASYKLFSDGQVDYVFSITKYPFPIQRAIRKDQYGLVTMVDPAQFTTRSQDLEEMYHDAGQFYWGTPEAWLKNKPVFNSKSLGYYLPRYQVQDIDEPEDWIQAELMHKALRETSK